MTDYRFKIDFNVYGNTGRFSRPHGSLKIRKHWTCNFVIDKSGSFDSDLVPFNVSDRLKVRSCVRR